MKRKCFVWHKWSKWKFLETLHNEIGNPSKLKRKCTKCGKEEVYIGLVNKCIQTGYLSPYIYSH